MCHSGEEMPQRHRNTEGSKLPQRYWNTKCIQQYFCVICGKEKAKNATEAQKHRRKKNSASVLSVAINNKQCRNVLSG
jgi:hypothetical protein